MESEVKRMFEIDKKKFGAFLSQLRKEKGYTQKDLAQKLFLSDKAVSKWETGGQLSRYRATGAFGGPVRRDGHRASYV